MSTGSSAATIRGSEAAPSVTTEFECWRERRLLERSSPKPPDGMVTDHDRRSIKWRRVPTAVPTYKMQDRSVVLRPTSPPVWSVRGGSVCDILDEELLFIVDSLLDAVGEQMGRITQLVIEADVEHRGGHFPFDVVEHLIDRRRQL